MASRVVRPETKTLAISNGDWLLVKKRLNHGERQDAFARRYVSEGAGISGVRVNLRKFGGEKITAYLLDWSLTGLDDKQMIIRDQPVEVLEAFLNAIDENSFKEIADAIDAHEVTMIAEREAEKNGQGTESRSPVISGLPVAATGNLIGCEN